MQHKYPKGFKKERNYVYLNVNPPPSRVQPDQEEPYIPKTFGDLVKEHHDTNSPAPDNTPAIDKPYQPPRLEDALKKGGKR